MSKYKLIKQYPGSPSLGATYDSKVWHSYLNAIEEYPEFWEEIKEKDYQILGYKSALDSDIYSVKRLSDGEVFTIGDKLANGELSKIDLIKENLQFYFKEIFIIYDIKYLTKAKQPLFTTEDGVQVYLGEDIYFVGTSYIITKHSNIDQRTFQSKFDLSDNPLCKWFSTKEAAEEYILMNKPCLSINQVLDTFFDKHGYMKIYSSISKPLIDKLKGKVK